MTWEAFDDDFLSVPATKARLSVVKESAAMDPTDRASDTSPDVSGSRGCCPSDSCCGRMLSELTRRPHFQTKDPATGRVLDIPESFAPDATFAIVFWKLLLIAMTVGYILYDWIVEGPKDQPVFYLAFPTHWVFLFCAVYAVFSLCNTLWAFRTPQPDERVGWRIALTWVFSELALHSVILMAVVRSIDALVPHQEDHASAGDIQENQNTIAAVVLSFLVAFDACVVNRIPFRWLHWFFYVLPVESLWVIWSVLHQLVFDLGNPYNEDPQDNKLFNHVNWEEEPIESIIYCVAVLVGAGFVIFGVLWLISIYQLPCCSCFVGAGVCNWKDKRHYLDSFKDKEDERPRVEDVEEGTLFARWMR